MSNRICKLKTFKALMRGMHNELMRFFNFKECGILFYDNEKHKLFTISLSNDDNEDNQYEGHNRKMKRILSND